MSVILIIIVVLVVLVIGVSLALGRSTYEVDSARDTEYLELEGDWVRYDVIGGGPPVVLVHGWLSSSAVWDQLAHRLAQRFTVYTLDLTGFGESDKPLSGYGVRYGSRLLYAFCAHFGLARASVVGHDLGGAMAMKLASDHPDVVGRVILVATPANEEQIDLPTPLWAATLPVVGPIFYALGRAIRPVRSMWMKPFVLEPEDVTEEMLEDAANSTPAAMSQTLSVGRREIGGGRLARQSRIMKVPVLVITGEEDQIVDPQAAGVWARSLDQAEVCLMDDCGHMPMIERPGEFNAQVLAFLTGDARYLEYIERDSPKTATEDPEESPRTSATDDIDTMEVDTLHGEDEAPAFGPPPTTGETNEADEDDEEPEPRRARPRRRLSAEDDPDPDFDEGARGESAFGEDIFPPERRPPEDRTHEPTTPDESSSGAESDDARTFASEDPDEVDDKNRVDDPDAPDPPDPVVRRLGDRLSGGSESSGRSRRATRSERAERRRLREAEMGDETTGPDLPPSSSDAPESSTTDRDAGHVPKSDVSREPSPFTEPESTEPEGPADRAEPRRESPPLQDQGHQDQDPPRPRRRPRREVSGEGAVPEVPSGLFDWGDSLDDFEPTKKRRPRAEERDDKDEDPQNPKDDDASGEPPPRRV